MAVLSQFSEQDSEFLRLVIKNGEGYQMYLDEKGMERGAKESAEGIKSYDFIGSLYWRILFRFSVWRSGMVVPSGSYYG